MQYLIKLFVGVQCFYLLVGASAGEQQSKPPSRAQCDAWVQQLANRSERPFEGYVHRSPKNIDRKALGEVKVAYDNLSMHFVESLPSLIGGLSDKRYSYYQEVPSNGVFTCHNVGGACYDIITANIETRRLSFLDKTGVLRSVHFITAMGGAEKWYETRKRKSLFELQLEAIDWALQQPRDERIEQTEWDRGVVSLRKFRDEFTIGQKAIDPKKRLWFEGK